jgi:UDP-N-acetylmuramoyl-tripeptide--D-alanyl-D-alanine ligase
MSAVWGKIAAKEIVIPMDGVWVSGKHQTILRGLSTDSRSIGAGELFWALKGEQYDGHDFAGKAIKRGAAGIVVQKDYWKSEGRKDKSLTSEFPDPVIITVTNTLQALGDLARWWRQQHDVQLVAITGSAGKTTTKEMAASILELGQKTLKNQGNYNNLIGLPLTIVQLNERYRRVVLEMGMNHPGEIARLTKIADPDVGVITNVGMVHLEGLGDLEGVARAKVELVENLSSKGKVILNGDDELLVKTASIFRKDALLFGLGEKNHVRAHRIRNLGKEGISFDLQYQGDSWPVRTRVPGVQNVLNGLAAAAVCLCLNEPPENIVEGLARFAGVKGRFMVMPLAGGVTLVDDTYNANPLSLKAALESVGALIGEGSRIIVGLGEMMELGDATVSAHRKAGQMVAGLGASHFFAIGDHTHEMIQGAVGAGMPFDRAEAVRTHEGMAKRIREEMREGDIVFLKGSRKMTLEKVVKELKGRES